MTSSVEKKVAAFYSNKGWHEEDGLTEDARLWEDCRDCAAEYVSKCRLRVLRHIPESGDNILDMASGPIQYPEYLAYSRNFKKRYCVDLSQAALDGAKNKIGEHGVYLHGSFFDINLEENFFDCSISLHTIYHMHKDTQEDAVRKLLYVTLPGKPVIIVYSNPDVLVNLSWLRKIKRFFVKKKINDKEEFFYFSPHSNNWWQRFANVAEVRILPWRSFAANHQKEFIPDNYLGKKIFDILYWLEDCFPNFWVRHFQYQMIVLTKRAA